ncbi:HEAT repeat domain-containing protein [Parolsenella catena]|uniref:HEAT repeat domain-containing protein n=1 Tax=Parolsenella catena TaxID=2003188 RepID=UPI00319E438E
MTEENSTPQRRKLGEGVITIVDRLIDELAGPVRRTRQEAASTLAEMAREHADRLEPDVERVTEALVDALYRPEAQTRWEALGALREVATNHPELAAQAYEGAEASLFDENSSRVRIEAFRLLARLGASSPELSDKVWPLLDEAIQCFHGDLGYRDMLDSLLEFAEGSASDASKQALVERISFDVTGGRGYVKTCSAKIADAVEAGK